MVPIRMISLGEEKRRASKVGADGNLMIGARRSYKVEIVCLDCDARSSLTLSLRNVTLSIPWNIIDLMQEVSSRWPRLPTERFERQYAECGNRLLMQY